MYPLRTLRHCDELSAFLKQEAIFQTRVKFSMAEREKARPLPVITVVQPVDLILWSVYTERWFR
jgi:hypothetical protein